MTKKINKKYLLLLGIFLVFGGTFGVYMWASGSDSNAWFSATLMLFFGIVFLIVGGSSINK
jgi:Na+/melibiose symporter-like transporter